MTIDDRHLVEDKSSPAGNIVHVFPPTSIDLFHLPKKVWRGNSKWCRAGGCQWTRMEAASLRSAVNGGQWDQVKIAKVHAKAQERLPEELRTAQVSDLCQLCFSELGTFEHRHRCTFTKPALGWSPGFSQAELEVLDGLPMHSMHLLCTRGLHVIDAFETRLVRPGWVDGHWSVSIPVTPVDFTYYVDGCLLW